MYDVFNFLGNTLEDAVFAFWVARCQKHDKYDENIALDQIKPLAQELVEKLGLYWDARLDAFLIAACLNYSRSNGVPFKQYLWKRLCDKYAPWKGEKIS